MIKKTTTLFTATTCMSLFILIFTGSVFAQNADEQAIIKVLEGETDAFYRRDFDAWKSYWIRDNKVTRMTISKNVANYMDDAAKSEATIATFIKNNPQPSSFRPKKENFKFRIDGNLAWVEYDAYTPRATGPVAHTHEYRIMIRGNGQWKLANQIVTWPTDYKRDDPAMIEDELNRTGNKLVNAKRLNEAIEVFKTNAKMHPNSPIVYESLGKAYELTGDKEEAIKNFEQSLKLNPESKNAKDALLRLKQ